MGICREEGLSTRARVSSFGQGEKRRRKLFRNSDRNAGNRGRTDGKFAIVPQKVRRSDRCDPIETTVPRWTASFSGNCVPGQSRIHLSAGPDSPRYPQEKFLPSALHAPRSLAQRAWQDSQPLPARCSFGNERVPHGVQAIGDVGPVAHIREPLWLEDGRVRAVTSRGTYQ